MFPLNRNDQKLMIFYCFTQIKNTSVHTVHDQEFVICVVWIISFFLIALRQSFARKGPRASALGALRERDVVVPRFVERETWERTDKAGGFV